MLWLPADVWRLIFALLAAAPLRRVWRAARLVCRQWHALGAVFDACRLCARYAPRWQRRDLQKHDARRTLALAQHLHAPALEQVFLAACMLGNATLAARLAHAHPSRARDVLLAPMHASWRARLRTEVLDERNLGAALPDHDLLQRTPLYELLARVWCWRELPRHVTHTHAAQVARVAMALYASGTAQHARAARVVTYALCVRCNAVALPRAGHCFESYYPHAYEPLAALLGANQSLLDVTYGDGVLLCATARGAAHQVYDAVRARYSVDARWASPALHAALRKRVTYEYKRSTDVNHYLTHEWRRRYRACADLTPH